MAKSNQPEENSGVNPMVASLAGAAIGAAVGAGAVILSDQKNRAKLEKTLEGLKKQGFHVLDLVQKEADKLKPAEAKVEAKVKKTIKKATKKKS